MWKLTSGALAGEFYDTSRQMVYDQLNIKGTEKGAGNKGSALN